MEKITIIIPVFNGEKYIKNCISSICCQSYQNLEILVINDGSTDNTNYIVREIMKKDTRIHLIEKDNGGVSSARNMGLKYATGDYVIFIDADDSLEIDMISSLYEMMIKTNADISHCGYKRVDEDGNLIKEVCGSGTVLEQNSTEAIRCMLEGDYFVGGLWNKLFKRAVIEGIIFNENLKNHEDILFNVLAFRNARKIVFFDETKYLYYEHPTSACHQMTYLRQSCDALKAADIMFSSSSNDEELLIIKKHLTRSNLECLKALTMNKMEKTEQAVKIKAWLNSHKEDIAKFGKKSRLNHFVLCRFGWLYRVLYGFYNRVRIPNWDVRQR